MRPQRTWRLCFIVFLLLNFAPLNAATAKVACASVPSTTQALFSEADGDNLSVRFNRTFANAIDSIKLNDLEIIESSDFGRLAQSAVSLGVSNSPLYLEQYNPTEAGSRTDVSRCRSSSVVLEEGMEQNRFHSCTQMAFWLEPGGESHVLGHYQSQNKDVLSGTTLCKDVTIEGHRLVIDLEFKIDGAEMYDLADIEIFTIYARSAFRFPFLRDLEGKKSDRAALASLASEGGGVGVKAADPAVEVDLRCDQLDSANKQSIKYFFRHYQIADVNKLSCRFRTKLERQTGPNIFRFKVYLSVIPTTHTQN